MEPKDKLQLTRDLSIDIYGGYREIGGNIIVIRFKDEAITLDLGLNLSLKNRFYTWPAFDIEEPHELFRLGIARVVPGLYTEWVDPYTPNEPYETDILGVFISHLHIDHTFMIPQINRGIPIFMGEAAKIIYDAKREVSRRRRYWVDDNIIFKTFRSHHVIKIGSFKVTPVHVDHSIPGAYGFKIETPDGVIAYSGDYRLHGALGEHEISSSLTMDFIYSLSEDEVSLFITEGTKFEDTHIMNEKDVEEKIRYLLDKCDATVLALFSETDIDRLRSFINVAKKLGWEIMLPLRHFYIIKKLIENDPHIKVDFDQSIISVYCRRKTRYERWEKDVSGKAMDEGYRFITLPTKQKINKTILVGFLGVRRELMKMNIPIGSIAILSYSEPVDEESEFQLDKLLSWLKCMNVPSFRVHSSGHIYLRDLREVINQVKPKDIYIIHSEFPDEIKSWLGY